MHAKRSCCRAQAAALEGEDLGLQSAVLLHLLVSHPIQLTEAELIAALNQGRQDFGERDDIERAVRQLAAVGLLHRHGDFVLPSAPAFRSHELWEGGAS
jgi:hypothetical protein